MEVCVAASLWLSVENVLKRGRAAAGGCGSEPGEQLDGWVRVGRGG